MNKLNFFFVNKLCYKKEQHLVKLFYKVPGKSRKPEDIDFVCEDFNDSQKKFLFYKDNFYDKNNKILIFML